MLSNAMSGVNIPPVNPKYINMITVFPRISAGSVKMACV